ncbi:transposase [Streptomyces sp. MMBL 11-3]|uniref:transposase n=1 Tax=Streptomyces sp. MMBL 11-3 TaxID=3382639 RepID=UPI0039B3680F
MLSDRAEQWEYDRHEHSSDRITVEHALADRKRRKHLMRWTHRCDRLLDTYRVSAGVALNRAATA